MKKIKIVIHADINIEWEINNPIRNFKRNPHNRMPQVEDRISL